MERKTNQGDISNKKEEDKSTTKEEAKKNWENKRRAKKEKFDEGFYLSWAHKDANLVNSRKANPKSRILPLQETKS